MIIFVVLVAASLLGVIAALLVRGVLLGYPPPALESSILSRKEQAVVAACADALFPAGGPIPLSGTEAGLVRYMDGYLRRMPAQSRALARLLWVFTEHGPWIFGPKRRRFTRLLPAERAAVLDDMRTSRIYFRRIAFLSLRTMLTMGYLANGDVATRMGMVSARNPFQQAFV
jgi:hypothetical protein